MGKTRPYNLGAVGMVQVAAVEVAHSVAPSNGDGVVEVVTLPAGCLVLRAVAEVQQAFNAGTTNVLTVGSNSPNFDNLLAAADVDESTPGFAESAAAKKLRTTGETSIKAKYAQTGAVATAGKALVIVEFVRLNPY